MKIGIKLEDSTLSNYDSKMPDHNVKAEIDYAVKDEPMIEDQEGEFDKYM